MKKMLFVLLLVSPLNCIAEHILLNFWEDSSHKIKQPFQMPLSFATQSTVFKAMLRESNDDLPQLDRYIQCLPFTIETMRNLVALTDSLAGQELRKSSDIDIVLDQSIEKTLYLLEAARFFNLENVVEELQDIIIQECADQACLLENQRATFNHSFMIYFSLYNQLKKLWLLSENWQRKWHYSQNSSPEFYLGHRPRSYSIFTLVVSSIINKDTTG